MEGIITKVVEVFLATLNVYGYYITTGTDSRICIIFA